MELVWDVRHDLDDTEQEYPDRHKPSGGTKQWMAPAVDTQLNQLFHTLFPSGPSTLTEQNTYECDTLR